MTTFMNKGGLGGLALLAALACQPPEPTVNTPPPPPPPAPVATIAIAPDTVTLVPGGSVSLVATPRDASGNPLQRAVSWTSSDPTVVTISSSGFVTALSTGSAVVVATAEGVSATSRVSVKEGATVGPNGGTLTGMAGRVSLAVPGGVFTQATMLTVEPATTFPPDARFVPGTAVTFNPSGMSFSPPLQLRLRYDAAMVPAGVSEQLLRLHRLVSGAWQLVPGGTVDVANKVVMADLTSFSTFGIVAIPAPTIVLSTTTLNVLATQGGQNPGTAPITITNGGGGTLSDLRAEVTYGSGASGWLNVGIAPTSATPVATLSLEPLITGLLPGTYSATVRVTAPLASNSPQAVNVTLTVAPPPLVVSTTSVPDGTVGTPYGFVLQATGGIGGYTWLVQGGSLAPGVSLGTDGRLSGVPTAPGSYAFTAEVRSGSQTATRQLVLTVAPPPLAITTPPTLPPAQVGASYSLMLQASGGTGGYVWSIQGGTIPPGLSIAPNGSLGGVAVQAGSFSFLVQVNSGAQSSSRTFSLAVSNPPLGIISTSDLPHGVLGVPYSFTFQASGGNGSYVWAIQSGTVPVGMTFSASGVLSGTPAASGPFSFVVQVASSGQVATQQVSLTIAPPSLTILSSVLPDATTGVPFSFQFQATGGSGNYGWSLANGSLPPGLSLSASGTLGGIPITPGTFPIGIRVTSGSQSATGQFTLTVIAGPDPCGSSQSVVVAVGQALVGSLTPSDCHLSDGSYADVYRITLSATTRIQVDLVSSAFDPLLVLQDGNRTTINLDDDSGDGLNARVIVSLAAGTYYILATSFHPGATGPYQLSVQLAQDPCHPIATLRPGQAVSGTLRPTGCPVSGGLFADIYALTVTSGGQVQIDLTSSAFDSYLALLDANDAFLGADDDSGGGLNARIVTTLGPGTYYIIVTSFLPGQTGPYQLRVATVSDPCSASTSIAVGQAIGGTLRTSACRLNDGSYADVYQLVLSGTQQIQIDMLSATFDAFLILQDANRVTIASDDDSGGNLNARLNLTLGPGTYYILANSFVAGATGPYTLSVSAAISGGLDLSIQAAYLTQATQRLDGSVPLVAGRDAYLRVFVLANQSSTVQPQVRVRLYNGANLIQTYTISAPTASVPTGIDESALSRSWNVRIAGALVQPGLGILADVDPDNIVAEASEVNNQFPTSGSPLRMNVVSLPAFAVRFVPILQEATGLQGNVSSANQESFLTDVKKMLPVGAYSADVRAPFTTSTSALQPNGAVWDTVLSEVDALRAAEASARYYYGVVKVGYPGGVVGMGYIGAKAAIGWDQPSSMASTMAHEIGHNMGRWHAPACGAGGPDPNYPYSGGQIGVWGLDLSSLSLMSPTTADLMGYCNPKWISDYNWLGMIAYRQTGPDNAPAVSGEGAGLLVWGRITPDGISLEPAFEVPTGQPPVPGSERLELLAADGSVLGRIPFSSEEVADSRTAQRHFAFVLRLSAEQRSRLSGLRVVSGARAATRIGGLAPEPTVSVSRISGQQVELRWDATRHPMVMVRDANTGEILSFARRGVARVWTTASDLELRYSNGVHTDTRRIRLLR